MHDYGNLARDHGPTTVTKQNETLVGTAVAPPLAVGERLVNFLDDVADDLLDRSRPEQTEKPAIRQNRGKDVDILGSLLDRLRNPSIFSGEPWGPCNTMANSRPLPRFVSWDSITCTPSAVIHTLRYAARRDAFRLDDSLIGYRLRPDRKT